MKLYKILTSLILALSLFSGCDKTDLEIETDHVFHVKRNGASMPVYFHGNGASKVVLIMLHGGPGADGLQYRTGLYAEELERNFAVAYWDQRSSGMSQGNFDESVFTVEEMAEDLRAVIAVIEERYGNDLSIFLMGHSWGGMLGTHFLGTKDYQNLVSGWIEISGAHDIPLLHRESIKLIRSTGLQQIAEGNSETFWVDAIDKVNQMDSTGILTQSVSDELNTIGFEGIEKLRDDGFINELQLDGYKGAALKNGLIKNNPFIGAFNNSITQGAISDHVLNRTEADKLPNITVPSFFLWGELDLVVPPALGQQAYNLIGSQHKEFVLLPKSGHAPMGTAPNELATEIIDFVNEHK